MGEIRFVGTGETRGYPYLVCKKTRYMFYWGPNWTSSVRGVVHDLFGIINDVPHTATPLFPSRLPHNVLGFFFSFKTFRVLLSLSKADQILSGS